MGINHCGYRGANPWGLDHDPKIFGWGSLGRSRWVSMKYYYILVLSYNVQDYEIITLSKSGDISEIERLVLIN